MTCTACSRQRSLAHHTGGLASLALSLKRSQEMATTQPKGVKPDCEATCNIPHQKDFPKSVSSKSKCTYRGKQCPSLITTTPSPALQELGSFLEASPFSPSPWVIYKPMATGFRQYSSQCWIPSLCTNSCHLLS